MNTTIITAIIAAIGAAVPTIITVIVTNRANNIQRTMQIKNLETQIEELSRKVEQHNTFDRRIVVLETETKMLKDQLKIAKE